MIELKENSDFSIHNLPFGIFSNGNSQKRAGVAIGEFVIDLDKAHKTGLFDGLEINAGVFQSEYLNDFIGLGKGTCKALRKLLQDLISQGNKDLEECLLKQEEVNLHLPVRVGDYTDFYSSKEHATNVGIMFRGKDNALMPNWTHMPIGYHGRASSIIVSGEPFHRPKGQILPKDSETPIYGPTNLLDIELEMGFIIGKSTELGQTVSTSEAEDYVFGMVLFNDWSARDIQKWEYQPLGPFLGKSFASSISPWIVTMEALEYFKTQAPAQEPKPLDYLSFEGDKAYDIQLEVYLKPEQGAEQLISKSNHKYLYWVIIQQLAHHTVNGCNLNIGDMMASGTISGPTPDSYGSLLELTWRGEKPLRLEDGTERKFLKDFDTVIIRGHSERNGRRIGFGEIRTQILPAK